VTLDELRKIDFERLSQDFKDLDPNDPARAAGAADRRFHRAAHRDGGGGVLV